MELKSFLASERSGDLKGGSEFGGLEESLLFWVFGDLEEGQDLVLEAGFLLGMGEGDSAGTREDEILSCEDETAERSEVGNLPIFFSSATYSSSFSWFCLFHF
ncbi:hypothetical protein PanWU01x14_226220 [Parasponia andersonii]|uniref:Uncharacterized protein n=1 Tax=Parasponia andersonii TaxID=3476 RepID=A0A2P5BMF5_PARAD|nr:hypothetical protein PanWU01x14_226220 [Parasponia andersonii]